MFTSGPKESPDIIGEFWPTCFSTMKPELNFIDRTIRQTAPVVPRLLIAVEPWYKVFLRNLWDLFCKAPRPDSDTSSPPGDFWTDVFVPIRYPWLSLSESVFLHGVAIVALLATVQLWPRGTQLVQPVPFKSSDVVKYEASEYLAPLNTGVESETTTQNSDPALAPQPIISVPRDADNSRQTIVSPPPLKLKQDVSLPNIVSWEHPAPVMPAVTANTTPSQLRLPSLQVPIVAPAPEVTRSTMNVAPSLSQAVVAPAPDVQMATLKRNPEGLKTAVVAPAPGVEMASLRTLSDINIGRSDVVAPAPQLPMDEQHALSNLARGTLAESGRNVVPPPPSIDASSSVSNGRLIALNVHAAAPAAPTEAPNGNRSGAFAAGPDGKMSGTGTPGKLSSDGNRGLDVGKSMAGVPAGLLVGSRPGTDQTSNISGQGTPHDPKPDPSGNPMVASVSPPRVVATELSPDQESEAERQVFAGRRSYSMMLNIPNLNSAGGSLVMHFSELQQEDKQGDLLAPIATRAVAPGYPLELMRENVQGTVTLSAVIHSDGRVGDVQVVTGVDDRLDDYARNAILRWQFLPALRNGKPVALQAVVKIPFKARAKAGF